ncbi:clarin-3 [Echeneis naucrates]|uniref:Clarin 3 n=1 Tax=Echeneis naucrates TaxID=173247 RepID=A0A665VD72_ECHNA|nr:clarin-3 [Echeneis naucrates]
MPSTSKTLYYTSCALLTSISVGLMGYAMSREWVRLSMDCSREEINLFNGSATITLELFNGNLNRVFCPTFGEITQFSVIPKLAEMGVTALVLYALVVMLLALCLLFSAGTILISLYNSVSNPYETYFGPVGVYTCSSISTCLSIVVLIIYVVNVNLTTMAEDLVQDFSGPVDLRNKTAEMLLGYYLVIPYTVLSLCAMAIIYMYNNAAYRHRREQQRPTEDSPKEIMMF